MSICKKCGGEIKWNAGLPVEIDGSDHFDVCSKLQWERIVATGKRVVWNDRSGYVMPDGEIHLDRIWGVFTKATEELSECGCCVPPWEDCEHTLEKRTGNRNTAGLDR